MKNKIKSIYEEVLSRIDEIKDLDSLKEVEIKYFSRKGKISAIMHSLKDLSLDLKKELGELANTTKRELEKKLAERKESLLNKLAGETMIDVSLPGRKLRQGHLNPITIVQNELEDLFTSLGFMVLDGPELESDYYNFTAFRLISSKNKP